MISLLVPALIAAAAIVFLLTSRRSISSRPGPPALNLGWGPDIASFFNDPRAAVAHSVKRGDSGFSIAFGLKRRWHFLHDRSLFKPYFQANEETLSLQESVPILFEHLLGRTAFGGPDHPEWGENYKKVVSSGLWRANQLAVFDDAMVTVVDRFFEEQMTKHAESGEWFDFTVDLHRLVALVNLRVFFGEQNLAAFGEVWQDIFPELDKLSVDQLVAAAPWLKIAAPVKRFWQVKEKVFGMSLEAWDKASEVVREKMADSDSKTPLYDSYAELVAHTWGDRLPRQILTEHILAVIFAAHINTANSLIWTTALVALNPTCVSRIRKEADEPQASSSANDGEASSSGSYAFHCMRESNRLYPISATMRIAMNDMQLPGSDYWVKKGDMVSITPLSIHRSKEIFSDEPEKFKPERFENEEVVKNWINSLTYVAFGSGSHKCLGEKYVLRIARRWLSGLFSRYDVEMKEKTVPEPRWSTTSNPAPSKPILIRLKPRS